MKKGSFLLFLILFVILCITLSGCLTSILKGSDASEKTENIGEVLEIYELNIFLPIISGEEKAVEAGTYYATNSEIQVVRVVNSSKEIALLKESSLFSFREAEYDEIYFITSENFSMTADGIRSVSENPELLNLNYSKENLKRSPKLVLEENFSGILVYTFHPGMNGTSFAANDGAEAIQIILPEKTTTGNRIIGKASPTQDSTEKDELGRDVLKWNKPVSSVSVKYYSENAPLYLLIAFSSIAGIICAIYLWNKYQIKRLHEITKLIDSDENSGFRKSK